MKFEALKLNDQLLEALSYAGFTDATPIQQQTIPAILDGKDVLAFAQTGTGKTAAFLLPTLNKIAESAHNHTSTLILAPTRELAIQIEREIQGFAYFLGINSMPVYGGGTGIDFSEQKKALTDGTDIIVATPGKLISHLNMGYVKFDQVKYLILDEADRMLDMGFYDDIQKIISYLPKKRQTLMFSATMAASIKKMANEILVNPIEVKIAISKPAEGVVQGAYLVYEPQKIDLVTAILKDKDNYKSILIFSSRKKKVFDIVKALKAKKFNVEGISSDLEQTERQEVLMRFTSKKTRILVGTDVISRGIDIKDINLVINFDVPGDAEDYVHRIGRTARADTTGVGLTFVSEPDMEKFDRIEKLIEKEVEKLPLPEGMGDGPAWNPRPQKGKFGNKRKSKNRKKKKKNPNHSNQQSKPKGAENHSSKRPIKKYNHKARTDKTNSNVKSSDASN
ncbi:MAG: DEAD/DEAH box helicase [Chitinophagales bacterium]